MVEEKRLVVGFPMNNRGAGEAISFIPIVMLMMLAVLNVLPPIQTVIQYAKLVQVHRNTLLRMELTGGMTPDVYLRAVDELAGEGFDTSQVEIEGTPAAVDYGGPLYLTMRYRYTYRNYVFSDFLIYPSDTPRVMAVEGSSVSFHFEK